MTSRTRSMRGARLLSGCSILILCLGSLGGTPADAQNTGNHDKLIRAAVMLSSSAHDLERAYGKAQTAYFELKRSDAPDFLHSLEAANREAQNLVKSQVLEKALIRLSSQAGTKQVSRAIPYIGLAQNLTQIYELLRIDSRLISANARANLTTLLVLRPTAQRYERAYTDFRAALMAARATSTYAISIGTDGASLHGSCRVNWSGPARVEVVVVEGGLRRERRTACDDGRWTIALHPASYLAPSVGYAALYAGNKVVALSDAVEW